MATVDTAPNATAPNLSTRGVAGWKIAAQALGVLCTIALLAWCVSQAFKPANRAQLEKLAEAPWELVTLLLMLSAAYILVNGAILWAGIQPTRKLGYLNVTAVQAICVVLGYLPLKLGTVFRMIVHNRRDGVPVLTIGAWLSNAFAVLLIVSGSLVFASMIHPHVDWKWAALAAAPLSISMVALVAICRALAGERGLGRAIALADRVPTRFVGRMARSRFFAHAHEGFAMLASPKWTSLCVLLRLLDVGVQSSRFYIAGRLLGVPVDPEQCVLIASAYFIIGIVSPTGAIGAREAGSTGLAAALGISALAATPGGPATFAVVALTVSATEALVSLTLASLGVVYLRPDRLLLKQRGRAEQMKG